MVGLERSGGFAREHAGSITVQNSLTCIPSAHLDCEHNIDGADHVVLLRVHGLAAVDHGIRRAALLAEVYHRLRIEILQQSASTQRCSDNLKTLVSDESNRTIALVAARLNRTQAQ